MLHFFDGGIRVIPDNLLQQVFQRQFLHKLFNLRLGRGAFSVLCRCPGQKIRFSEINPVLLNCNDNMLSLLSNSNDRDSFRSHSDISASLYDPID